MSFTIEFDDFWGKNKKLKKKREQKKEKNGK